MKTKYYFLIFVALNLLVRCTNKKQVLFGMWEVASIKSEKKNYEDELLGNIFFFLDENKLKVPRMVNNSNDFEGIWDIKVNNNQIDSLFIESHNIIYQGNYKVEFLVNNVNSRLFMKLKSKKMEILLYVRFRTKNERDAYINKYDIKTIQVPNDYFAPTGSSVSK